MHCGGGEGAWEMESQRPRFESPVWYLPVV